MVNANDFQYSRDEKEYVARQIAAHNLDETAHPHLLGALDELRKDVDDSVKKETGKGLSSNDYTDDEKEKVAVAVSRSAQALSVATGVSGELDNYVLKETGKGLSSNDYTDADKEKVTEAAGKVDIFAADMKVYARQEQDRVSAEKARQENETKRQNAENLRIQEEGSRVLQEDSRVVNEQARVSAEIARTNAEEERIRTERIRVDAEIERRAAEEQRLALYPEMVEATERATAIADNIDGLLSEKADKEELSQELDKKVDKVSGKGLSTNDYTDEEKESVSFAVKHYPEMVSLYPEMVDATERATEIADNIDGLLAEKVDYKEQTTVHLGNEFIDFTGTFAEDSGWSGGNASGYTHTATTASSDLVFEKSTENGSVYLLEFDTTYKSGEFVNIGIGSMYKNLAYNGGTHIVMPLMSDGGYLTITPVADKTFTITNLSLRKIQDEGEEKVLDVYNVTTNNHTQNYGFRNILLGDEAAENAVGSTRTIALGKRALYRLQGGHRNIALGGFVMSQMTGGEENIGIGADAMIYVQKGDENISIGTAAMGQGAELKQNIAIGSNTLTGEETSKASKNVCIGHEAGRKTTGNGNTFVGYNAGSSNKTGTNNICIGINSYGGQSGQDNICIGNGSQYDAGIGFSIAIGRGAKATKSYQTVIGGSSTTETLLKGNLVIQATDGTKKQIVFNSDGTVGWVTV